MNTGYMEEFRLYEEMAGVNKRGWGALDGEIRFVCKKGKIFGCIQGKDYRCKKCGRVNLKAVVTIREIAISSML